MKMKRSWPLWIFSVVVTLFTAYYQRNTGPTHPKKIEVTVAQISYTLSCPRSLRTAITPKQGEGAWEKLGKTTLLKIKSSAKENGARLSAETPITLHYRRARSQGDWETISATIDADGTIEAALPAQPPAGKLAYYLQVDNIALSKDAPIVVRFRNNVPVWVLVPHILFMYAAMLLSTICGLFALINNNRWKRYAWLSMVILLMGGLILGPIVQKFAFGAYWTGWPVGEDLTDTKTLIAACFWGVVILFSNKKAGRLFALLAAIALLAIFSIPHSTSGSEFNYESGLVGTERSS